MKVTLASLLCLVALTLGASVPSSGQKVRGAAVMENQPTDVMAIESGEYAQQPFEQNDERWKLRPHTINVITTPVLTTTLVTTLIIIPNITTPDITHTTTRRIWTIPADEYWDSRTTSISTPSSTEY